MNKNNIKSTMKVVGKRAGDFAVGTAKVVAVVAITALGTELGAMGGRMLASDVDFVGKCIKHKTDPDPILVKQGHFGKKMTITVSPTGKVEQYKGSKPPVNKKAVVLHK